MSYPLEQLSPKKMSCIYVASYVCGNHNYICIHTVNKTFEGARKTSATHNVAKTFIDLLNKNKSNFHVLKFVVKTFVVC